MDKVDSINDVPIRLTKERWFHILEGHPTMKGYYEDILETVKKPECVYEGNEEELIALKRLEKENHKYIVVVYKETSQKDGFIITSFLTKKEESMKRGKKVWP